MERYTLSLALFDYLPVIAGGIGMYFVCRYCSIMGRQTGKWVIVVPLIVFSGGFLKATWKTIVVVTGEHLVWMSDQLFFFLATGYILVAGLVFMGLRAAARGDRLSPNWWRVPATLAAIVIVTALALRAGVAGRSWNFMLLAVLSIANLVLYLSLIRHSLKERNYLAGAGFLTSLTLGYVLVGLARLPDQTLELQWIEEWLNFFSNTILALSAWCLLRMRAQSGETKIDV
jgi:hypothetical protein